MRQRLRERLKQPDSAEKGQYFRRSLVLVLLITSIPSLFIAASNYAIGINQVEKEVFKSHQYKIEQYSEIMNKQFDQISMVMSRWSNNPLFGDYLDQYEFIEHIDDMQKLMQSMLVVGGSNVLVDEADLFLNRQQALVTAAGIDYLSGDGLKRYQTLLQKKEGLFLTYGLPSGNGRRTFPVSIIFKLPWHSEQPFGAFVLNLNRDELERTIGYMQSSSDKGTTFLMQQSGDWVLEPKETVLDFSLALKQQVLDKGHDVKSFPFKWNGETYIVSFGDVTRAGWIYVTASPLSELTKPVLLTSRWILACSLAGLTAALLLAWLASRRLYRPIGRLVALFGAGKEGAKGEAKHEIEFIEQQWASLTRERSTLQERLQQAVPSLREGFLLQLAQGHLYATNEAGLRQRMEHLGWETEGRRFTVLLIQLSGFHEGPGKFMEQDRQLVSFAAANIAQELSAGRLMQAHAINFQDLSVGLLCIADPGTDTGASRKMLHELSQEFIAVLSKILRMHVTVIVCPWIGQVSRVPLLLEEARQASRFRGLQEVHQVIDLEAYEPPYPSSVQYPFAQEKQFLHVMRLGLEEEAYASFSAFMDEAERLSDSEVLVQQAILQLLGSTRHMLIELGFTRLPLFNEVQLYEEMFGLRDPAALKKWFRQKVIAPYLEEFGKVQNISSRRLVEQAAEMLGTRYMHDISLEECAEQFHTSPYTLSRSFKQVLGINYVDYIMKLRMDKAKELLTTTQMQINEIAERVGYQHSYFNKIFKGETQLTPTQYRNQFREK